MAAGYFEAGKADEKATFELAFRRLPPNRNYLLTAGLEQAVDYLLNLSFTGEEVEYLRGLPQFQNASPGFFDYLRGFRFTGDLFAMPEGTPALPRRAGPHAARAGDRGADPRDMAALRHRLPDHDRHQGGARGRGRGGTRRDRIRNAPGAHAGSGSAGRARRVSGRLRRHQQYPGGLPLRHPGDGNRGALVGDVVCLRDGGVPQTAAGPGRIHRAAHRYLRPHRRRSSRGEARTAANGGPHRQRRFSREFAPGAGHPG